MKSTAVHYQGRGAPKLLDDRSNILILGIGKPMYLYALRSLLEGVGILSRRMHGIKYTWKKNTILIIINRMNFIFNSPVIS